MRVILTRPDNTTVELIKNIPSNNGKTRTGIWKFSVYDNWTDDSTTLVNWNIELYGTPVLVTEDNNLVQNSFTV